MMKDMEISQFVQELSTKAAVPGGGTVSALAGALGMSLGNMVGNLTIGKKKYQAVEADIKKAMELCTQKQERMLALMDEDAEGFLPLSKAYGLPKDTKEAQAYRQDVMETALNQACQAPIHMMELVIEGCELLQLLAEEGSQLAKSDVGVGAAFLRASLDGAILNVLTNTKLMTNGEKAQEINRYSLSLKKQGDAYLDAIYDQIFQSFL